MHEFIAIIKGDYLQRTRSYAFLITLAISLYVAYTFVPPLDAPYTTVRVGNFVGDYNAAWIGHVTAIMTSVFLSLVGFFLVNSSIKKDVETEVGMIIATTQVSNFKYLISKAVSNFLVLLSITGLVFAMSVGLFFYRSTGFDFEVMEFLKPYLFVTLPALFLVSCVAVLAEVLLGRRTVIQYIGFFILFNVLIANVQIQKGTERTAWFDPFGLKVVTLGLEDFVSAQTGEDVRIASMGFNFSQRKDIKIFVFTGMEWPIGFLVSRAVWLAFGVSLVWLSSRIFHRFDVKEKSRSVGKKKDSAAITETGPARVISLHTLPTLTLDYGIAAFVKTELLMLFRKGPRWFWFVNLGGMAALLFAPIEVAHEFILPVLWFLQIGRFSDITTKEKTNRLHHFTFAAYQPLKRLLPAQILSGVILLLVLALPLLIRHAISFQALPVTGIVAGSIFIIMLSAGLGIVSGGKKLFEILFFMITYANLNRIPIADYFGYHASLQSITIVALLSTFLIITSLLVRSYEIRNS